MVFFLWLQVELILGSIREDLLVFCEVFSPINYVILIVCIILVWQINKILAKVVIRR